MVLNNYWKALNILKSIVNDGTSHKDSFGMIDIEGTEPPVQHGTYSPYMQAIYANINLKDSLMGVRLGKGTGTITAQDYALFDDCTDDISNLSITNSAAPTNEGYQNIITISGMNNTENEIVITEVGITKTFYEQMSTDIFTNPVMFCKILLHNLVIVPVGGAFTITIEWLEG